MTTSAKAGGGAQHVFEQRKAKAGKAKAEADHPDGAVDDETLEEEEAEATDSEGNEDEMVEDDDTEDEAKALSDKDRIKAILTCEDAQAHQETAKYLALETDMSPDQAKGVLASIKSQKASGQSPLQQAMASQQDTDIGADGGQNLRTNSDHGWGKVAAKLNSRFGMKKGK